MWDTYLDANGYYMQHVPNYLPNRCQASAATYRAYIQQVNE